MRPLTIKELTDILFQTPDRITADILERRSLAEKLRDGVLTREDKQRKEPGALTKLSKKLFLHFNAVVKVAEEHPRSLKKAALELKALGFTNKQVNVIKHRCYYFIVQTADSSYHPLHNLLKDYPGSSFEANDKAFLGTVLQPAIDVKNILKESKNPIKALEKATKEMRDPAKTKNTVFISAEREEQAYIAFQEDISNYIQRKNVASEFLMPARPHNRAAALLP